MPRSTIKGPQEGAITFNESSADVDFRVESDASTHMLFVDAGNNRVGIAHSSPSVPLSVQSDSNASALRLLGRSADDIAELDFYEADNSTRLVRLQAQTTGFNIRTDTSAPLLFKTNNTLAQTIDANGAITQPLQPAFLAYSNSTQSNFAADTATTINFNTEIFDQGADFNNSNYIFTAPVTGRYQLQFKAYLLGVPSDADFIYTQIITSNRNYQHIFDPAGFTGDFWFADTAVLADMDANDTAKVVIYNRLGTASLDVYGGDNTDPSTFFSGFLAC